jgi:NAD+ synthetase
MKEITDYGKVFETLVEKTQNYVVGNNLNTMVLGISGGIDSTVVAAICHEVSERTNIPLIGRSLPTNNNKEGEVTTADLVGKAFCTDYKEVSIQEWYINSWSFNEHGSEYNAIADGNIQARLRMIYLYNLAGIHRGLVMDTDNLTENNLGYFTIHGDVGDFNPIGGLWKTEVFKLAEWLLSYYSFQLPHNMYEATSEQLEKSGKIFQQGRAIKESLKLKPTAGLGVTDSDLEEIGAESYDQVDKILKEILAWKYMTLWIDEVPIDQTTPWEQRNAFLEEQQILNIPIKVIMAVTDRHFKSEFKRKQLPIKITRDEII